MTEKYIETNGIYFIRMPSGRLQQVTQDDWEQSAWLDTPRSIRRLPAPGRLA